MLSASDLKGFMAMMPAFATDDAADLGAAQTVDVGRLHAGVDRIVRDGADVVTTTGSFGECHSLLLDEFEVLVRETLAAVKGRVPVVVGVPSENAREAVRKIAIAQGLGAQAVIVAIPYYIPSTLENAVGFLRGVAERFPRMGILIYHNPPIHRVTLPVGAFDELVKIPNVIGMKDSHRDPVSFVQLQRIVHGKINVFVSEWQYFDYAERGAAGFWSIDAWMGPEPVIALRDAVRRGDRATAEAITLEIVPPYEGAGDLKWRETASKIGIRAAGYVDPGPLRAPFNVIPPEVQRNQERFAAHWRALCEKYAAARV
jgi:dihydrodipicolinate synthase/N-acetylneuraminate lyase